MGYGSGTLLLMREGGYCYGRTVAEKKWIWSSHLPMLYNPLETLDFASEAFL